MASFGLQNGPWWILDGLLVTFLYVVDVPYFVRIWALAAFVDLSGPWSSLIFSLA